MKEMIYKHNTDQEYDILNEGCYDGYDYYIISRKTHPCAYIVINHDDKFYGKEYDEIENVTCHGGFTYSEDNLENLIHKGEDRWVLGWDYAHNGDKYGTYIMGHAWSTQEILDEIKIVIQQILIKQ